MSICTQPVVQKNQERREVAQADMWNVEALYPSWDAWEEDMRLRGRESEQLHWPEIEAARSACRESPEKLKELLDLFLNFDRHLSKLYTYAHLRHDEDVAEETGKKAYVRISSLLHAFRQETAWIEPEILALPQEKLTALLRANTLSSYTFYLEKMVRMKAHMLSAEQEALVALAGKPLDSASHAFSAFNNADLKFAPVKTSQGELKELTHGKYLVYLRDSDRHLRKEAFCNVHKAFSAYENTVCELLNGQVQKHVFEAKARGFNSCLEAALFPNQVDKEVYTALIAAVRSHLPALHRYMKVRKKALGLSELHLYDLHVPLFQPIQKQTCYEEAVPLIIAALHPLGEEYQSLLKRGLSEERWVDRYENKNKRSGAYSSGCYDSMPYILMNYHGAFHDVMTLAHEAGHSMHSFFSHRSQPYHYSHYSIFVAEVASTFNEELVLQHLLKQAKTKEEKGFFINQQLDDMRATLLRQTLFAEFELKIHSFAEQGIPLTPALLKSEYLALNTEYFGPDVIIDEEIAIEWARIPHFYYNFYVYQYATGISAAQALSRRVLSGGEKERNDYLSFLSAGSSQYPIDVLKLAGVDMRTKEPVESAMRHFSELVDALEELIDSHGQSGVVGKKKDSTI